MEKDQGPHQDDADHPPRVEQLTLHVDEDLYRAFQRCVWIRINETGQSQIDLMNEMVRDFLVKHQC